MREVTTKNFGLLIAFVLPGFVLLWGIAPYSTTISGWIGNTTGNLPTVGGFLYVTLASVGLGQLVSTLRWLVIDTLHHRTGVRPAHFDFGRLRNSIDAYDRLIEIHYRYYQWHANGLVAVTLASLMHWVARGFRFGEFTLIVLIDLLLYLGSRDTLSKYYRRVDDLVRRDF